MLDGDVAQTLGAVLREELGVQSDILAIDGVVLWDFRLHRPRPYPAAVDDRACDDQVIGDSARTPGCRGARNICSTIIMTTVMGMVTRTGIVTTITTTTSSVADIAMADDDVDVAVIGGGAAGLAAARRLHDSGIRCLVIEARARLGGRAWTVTDASGYALDLGCGWLHSADRNPWSTIAHAQGLRIDRTPPPWTRPSLKIGFSMTEQLDYFKASHAFYERLDAAERAPDRPASELLDPGGRWNNLIIATNTFVSGTELDRISAHDIVRYDDTGVNWRVIEGYGAAIRRPRRRSAGRPRLRPCCASTTAGVACGSKPPKARSTPTR
jgi:hypothetical protein